MREKDGVALPLDTFCGRQSGFKEKNGPGGNITAMYTESPKANIEHDAFT
jgi:hypothetical protein